MGRLVPQPLAPIRATLYIGRLVIRARQVTVGISFRGHRGVAISWQWVAFRPRPIATWALHWWEWECCDSLLSLTLTPYTCTRGGNL